MTRQRPANGPKHFDSHRAILAPFVPGRARLGGIVIPATRDATSVMINVELGASLGVPVVVLCSMGAPAAEIVERARIRNAGCAVVDVSAPGSFPLPTFRTDDLRYAASGACGDLSDKRNLGLLLARLAGWKTVLFMDDDIRSVSEAWVREAVSGLTHHAAVGMPAHDFPDNSVVCHARRFLASQPQGVFVSGSALAVDVDAAESFFPRVYNEDWLFLAPLLERRTVADHGRVEQAYFNPFDWPERAARQEFGDVLAEGLIGHLHSGSLDQLPDIAYWSAFLRSRATFVAEAAAACRRQAWANPVARDALVSLKQAEATGQLIRPRMLVDYVRAWQADLEAWRKHLARVPRLGSLDAALTHLSLHASRHEDVPASKRPRSCHNPSMCPS